MKATVYVVEKFEQIGLAASVLGSGDGIKYACCGEVAMANGDPMLTQVLSGGVPEGAKGALSSQQQDALAGWENLQLYGVDVPGADFHGFAIKPFTQNPPSSLMECDEFVFITTNMSRCLAFAYMLERYKLNYADSFVVLLDKFYKSELECVSDRGNWLPFGEAFVDYLGMKKLAGWSKNDFRMLPKHRSDLKEVQKLLNMSNVQFARYFGFKLRTVENWRSNPDSVPGYIWNYLKLACFYQHDGLAELYDSDAESAYAAIG